MERGNSKLGYFIFLFIGVLIGAGLFLAIVTNNPIEKDTVKNKNENKNYKTTVIQQPIAENTGTSTISIVAKNLMPAVVGITAKTDATEKAEARTGFGSGFIVDKKGYILTNNHVASKQASDITVSLFDGRDLKGKVVWSDVSLDLSVLKIAEDNLTVAPIGDSKILTVGDTAIAIGNPLGLTFQRTVTSGIISAINRTINEPGVIFMEDLIQTDASINPGNSGGPLININSEVIGINTAKVESAEGIGFAIPINIVKPILKSIGEKGSFVTPILGIKGIDKQMVYSESGVKMENGIYIYEVRNGSPAGIKGIKKGDIILSVNGTSVNTMLELRSSFYNVGVGKSVALKVKRGNEKARDINVELVGKEE